MRSSFRLQVSSARYHFQILRFFTRTSLCLRIKSVELTSTHSENSAIFLVSFPLPLDENEVIRFLFKVSMKIDQDLNSLAVFLLKVHRLGTNAKYFS